MVLEMLIAKCILVFPWVPKDPVWTISEQNIKRVPNGIFKQTGCFGMCSMLFLNVSCSSTYLQGPGQTLMTAPFSVRGITTIHGNRHSCDILSKLLESQCAHCGRAFIITNTPTWWFCIGVNPMWYWRAFWHCKTTSLILFPKSSSQGSSSIHKDDPSSPKTWYLA